MRSILSSPRRRRRLGRALGAALAVVAAVVVGVRWSNTAEVVDTPVESGRAKTAAAAPAIRITPAVRREVGETVQTFVHTAVIRRNLEEAWPLASPAMRQGLTRRQWERGDIPVQPFPAAALAGADWRIRYRYDRTLGIDVMVQPKEGSGAPVAVYAVEVSAPGSGAPRRFLVDSWVPQATLGAASEPPAPARTSTAEAQGGGADVYDQGRLGAEWFLVPAGILLVLVGTLGAFGLRSVVRSRRIEREYRSGLRR
jgi:hypothetical protein